MSKGSYSVILKNRIGSFNKTIKVDSDKSISSRSFIIGAISEGISKVKNVLESEDIFSTINCLRKLNCKIKKIKKGEYKIYGKGLGSLYCKKNTVLDFGNSGTACRILGFGVLSTNPNIQVKLTGDKSLSKRSMLKVIRATEQFGVQFLPKNKFHLPLTLISSEMPIGFKFNTNISSQIKSAVMLAATNSYGKTLIVEKIKSRDHTERMLKHNTNAIKIKKGKKNLIEIRGKESLRPINISIPGDPSSASFYATLCLLSKNSRIILKRVHINPTRIGFFNIIQKHNGKISFKNKRMADNEMVADVHVESSKIKNLKVEGKFFVSCQDEYPIMFAMAALLPGTSTFGKIADLSNKESPRAHEMKKILKQIGIRCKLSKDEMKIYGNPNLSVHGKKISVSGVLDHRVLISGTILSLLTGIKANLKNFEQVRSSCPNFLSTISSLGGKFEIKKNH
jgi:3-phosphoshikimate 1-carboxyvinyltransferase